MTASSRMHLCTVNDIGDLTNTADKPVESAYPLTNMHNQRVNNPTVFDLQGAIRFALFGTRTTAVNANCYALQDHNFPVGTMRHRLWDNENQGGAVVYDSASGVKGVFPGASGDYVQTPDGALNSITGDIQIIAKIAATDYTPGTDMAIVSKWDVTSDQRSFILQIETDGTISLIISNDGAAGTVATYTSTAAPSITDGETLWIKATLDADNGASNSAATFFTSVTDTDDPDSVSWSQLGAAVNSGATETIFNSDSVIEIGSTDDGTLVRFAGDIYRVLIYNGIDGTIVADYDPRQKRARDTLFHGNFPGSSGDYISSPDSVALSVTGDIEIVFQASMTDWTPAAAQNIFSKFVTTGNQRSWLVQVGTGGTILFRISTNGTATVDFTSTAAPTVSNGQKLWIRITLDADNGSSNSDCKFYTSADGVTWSQLGATVNGGAAVSIFDGTAPIEIGSSVSGTAGLLVGKVYKLRMYNGLVANGGTLVANFDANDYQGGSTWTASNTGEVYTINGNVKVNRFINSSVMAGELPGSSGDYFSSPDSAAASITGDIEIEVLVAATDWTPASDQTILGKWTESGDQRSYRWVIDTTGVLHFEISTSGAVGTVVTFTSTAAPTVSDGSEIWLKVALDVNTGLANSSARFYTSTDGETWTQLGNAVAGGAVVSIFDGTAVVEIGANNAGTGQRLVGRVKRARIYSAGTLAVDFNANDYEGSSPFQSINTGELWTINGNAKVAGQWALQGNVTVSETLESIHEETPASTDNFSYIASFFHETVATKSYRTDILATSGFTDDQASIDKQWIGAAYIPERNVQYEFTAGGEEQATEHLKKPGRGMETVGNREETRALSGELVHADNTTRQEVRRLLRKAKMAGDVLVSLDPTDAMLMKEETTFIGRRMSGNTWRGVYFNGNELGFAFEEN